MTRTILPTRIFALILFALLAPALLAPALLQAQDSFSSTHIALFRNVSGVPDSLKGSGIGIFRVDRVNATAEYRVSIVAPKTQITDIYVRTRTGATPQEDPIIETFVFPSDRVTASSTLDILLPAIFDLVDRGLVYLDVRSQALPEGHMIAQLEAIPTGVAFEVEKSQVVPEVDSSNGRGSAYVVVDPFARRARYHVDWRDLSSRIEGVSFHRAELGENGPPRFSITLNPGDTVADGVWEEMTADDIRAFKEGRIYVLIRTEKFKDGELRGQILPAETFTAAISGANEVPPNNSEGTGTGYLLMVTYPELGIFVKSMFVVGGMADTIQMAHVHRGAPGENGPVIFPYANDVLDLWDFQIEVPLGTISEENLSAIRTGNAYINVHTQTYQQGEARGQLIPSILNIASSVPGGDEAVEAGSMLAARVDGASGMIDFSIGKDVVGDDRRIILYSSLGERVAELEAGRDHHTLSVSALHSGVYIAQLLVDGRQVAVCRVVVAR